ncbi:MAG: sugar phosphate isomerase/epimerase family protein [Candidatus Poribacteria bacterium]
MKIGCMIWRIGDILDFNEQIEWVKAHDFDAVEFWTLPGAPGVWQGFDVQNASQEGIMQLKRALNGFGEIDIHAGFDEMGIQIGGLAKETVKMEPTFELAAEIGAQVITVHPASKITGIPEAESLERLNNLAGKYGVCVGIETMGGLATLENILLIKRLALPNIGITLDVGHLHFENGSAFESYGTLSNLIDEVNVKIVHVHAHDYDGHHDHLATGHGYIDFPSIIGALYRRRFSGSVCLEINPDREPPAGILETQKQLIDIKPAKSNARLRLSAKLRELI